MLRFQNLQDSFPLFHVFRVKYRSTSNYKYYHFGPIYISRHAEQVDLRMPAQSQPYDLGFVATTFWIPILVSCGIPYLVTFNVVVPSVERVL
jgi:hypothetical protein